MHTDITHSSRQTLKLHLVTVNNHHYGNLHFLHHAHVRFNHFNHALWVAIRCEASGASEATPAVAEASEASGSYLYFKLLVFYDSFKSQFCQMSQICDNRPLRVNAPEY